MTSSRRQRRTLVALGLLLALGVAGALVFDGEERSAVRATRTPPPPRAPRAATPRPAEQAPAVRSVWRIGGLSPVAVRRLRTVAGVEAASVVDSGLGLLRFTRNASGRLVDTAGANRAFPLDLVAVEPRSYALLLPPGARRRFERLGPGEALLSATSARQRRLGRGATLVLAGGQRLRVVGVVEDDLVRAAEVVVSRAQGRRLGTEPRYALLVAPRASARTLRRAAGPRARVRTVGAAPWRPAFGVERQVRLKARFGEFAVQLPLGRDWIRLDPGWVRRNVVTREVPILGAVTCHRAMIPALRAALGELQRRGLARLVDRGDYAGCYAPRRIPTSGAMSRHAWGLAIDLNAAANPYGARSRQDRRLVAAMERRGFDWGGHWPTPDAMHFELRRPLRG